MIDPGYSLSIFFFNDQIYVVINIYELITILLTYQACTALKELANIEYKIE